MLRFLPYLCRNCPPPLHPPPPPPYQCSPCYLYLRFTTTGKLEAQVQKELKKVSCPGNGPDKLISTRKLCESQSKILATNSQSFRVNKIGGVSWAKSIDLVVTAAVIWGHHLRCTCTRTSLTFLSCLHGPPTGWIPLFYETLFKRFVQPFPI